jgi:hypothetical protein
VVILVSNQSKLSELYFFLHLCRSVKISYKNLQKPVTYIRDAMKTAARVVDMDALPGFPPQGEAVGDVKGT